MKYASPICARGNAQFKFKFKYKFIYSAAPIVHKTRNKSHQNAKTDYHHLHHPLSRGRLRMLRSV